MNASVWILLLYIVVKLFIYTTNSLDWIEFAYRMGLGQKKTPDTGKFSGAVTN